MTDDVWLPGYEGAGRYLGVHRDTVRSYVKRKLLRAYRIRGSRLLRFKRSDLDGLMIVAEPVGESRQTRPHLRVAT